MRYLYLYLLLISSCSINDLRPNSSDRFDKIISLMKNKTTKNLYQSFGKPDEIAREGKDQILQVLKYKKSKIDVYLDSTDRNKISHLTIFFFEDMDNYAYLKKRFEKYKWLETKLVDETKSDVATELYLVRIPEIGMRFQYDNLAPKRKVMWIYFE